jgi:hypothetical protein
MKKPLAALKYTKKEIINIVLLLKCPFKTFSQKHSPKTSSQNVLPKHPSKTSSQNVLSKRPPKTSSQNILSKTSFQKHPLKIFSQNVLSKQSLQVGRVT